MPIAATKRCGESSVAAAKPGDTVTLAAQLIGYAADTPVTLKIFPISGDSGSPLATLAATADEKGLATVDWVVRFSEHRVVRELSPGEYLTVSLPPGGPSDVQGVRIADRAPLNRGPQVDHDEEAGLARITPVKHVLGVTDANRSYLAAKQDWGHKISADDLD